MSFERKISHLALNVGIFCCFIGAIWYPQDSLKWIGTSAYLYIVGKNFGLTLRNRKIVGATIRRPNFHLTNFLPMRGR